MNAHVYAAVLAIAVVMPAIAEDQCPPLKMLTSIDLVPSDSGRREYVPVEIAGVQKWMVLDLGAEISMLSSAAANELKLNPHHGYTKLYGLSGANSDLYSDVDVKMGPMKGRLMLAVAPYINDIDGNPKVVGLLGADVLSHYDVSIDFGTNKLELLDPKHCEGKVVYWPMSAVAIVPFKSWHMSQIVFDVTLDGKTMKAILDTGASNSTLRLEKAQHDFDIKPGSDDTPVAGHLNERSDLITYRHTFKTLDLEGIAVTNPVFELIPDMISAKLAPDAELGTRIPVKDDSVEAPILLGMNILKHLHIYVAYKEKKLYITPAGTPKEASAAQ